MANGQEGLDEGRTSFSALQLIPVAANDVAFSAHSVALTAFVLYQVFIYDRGNQTVSRIAIGITCIIWTSALVCLILAWAKQDWLRLVSIFNIIQVILAAIKYTPQAYMNFQRKSTVGWSIGNVLLGITGGILNLMQMAVQSIDQGNWVNFYGNIGKTLLALVSIAFDILFMVQHYALYPSKKAEAYPIIMEEDITATLLPSSDPGRARLTEPAYSSV